MSGVEKKLKVVVVHNQYQILGGEDTVFEAEIDLLTDRGVEVVKYFVDSKDISTFLHKLRILINLPFSVPAFFRFYRFLRKEKPDVVHVHNYFPLLTPSVFYVCSWMGVPVVHTLHNYRAICPTAILMHNEERVYLSIEGGPFWGAWRRVYKGSFIASLALAFSIWFNKIIGTWRKRVDIFIVLSSSAREIFVRAGWPAEKICLKPNFIRDPMLAHLLPVSAPESFALFVGRLSPEKGCAFLIENWPRDKHLQIIGSGPLARELEQARRGGVCFLGSLESNYVYSYMARAKYLLAPSLCEETFGMVVLEALACGTPVVASNLGGIKDLVDEGLSGFLFEPGNKEDFNRALKSMESVLSDAEGYKKMRAYCRKVYMERYAPNSNYLILRELYAKAVLNKEGVVEDDM